jgi:hypothetical protein
MIERGSVVPPPRGAGGASDVWFEEPDTVFIALRGYISEIEGAQIFRAQNALLARLRYAILICDIREVTGMSSGARRQLVDEGKGGTPRAVVVVAASHSIRTLAELISRGMISLGLIPAPGFRFARDLAEARALVPAIRRELQSQI